MPRTAVVAGYTGLIGRHLVEQLLREPRYAAVKLVGRREPAQQHAKLETVISELGDLGRLRDRLVADDAFCCLGTTIKAAGSRAAFERVDYHMVVDFARVARAAGAQRFFLVSSLSAHPRSPVYYSRIKGRTEAALREVGFETLHIVQPSLLLGERVEHRAGEALAQRLAPAFNLLLPGPLKKYRAIQAADVATALIELAARERSGVFVHSLPLESA